MSNQAPASEKLYSVHTKKKYLLAGKVKENRTLENKRKNNGLRGVCIQGETRKNQETFKVKMERAHKSPS